MTRLPTRVLVLAGLAVALTLAGLVSFYASRAPDGLNRVAGDHGLATSDQHLADGSPMAGYRARGVHDARLSTGVAGVTGAVVVLVLAGGLTLVLRRRGPHGSDEG